MIFYAAFVCIVLALIRKDSQKSRVRYGLILFLIMIFGSLLFECVTTNTGTLKAKNYVT